MSVKEKFIIFITLHNIFLRKIVLQNQILIEKILCFKIHICFIIKDFEKVNLLSVFCYHL